VKISVFVKFPDPLKSFFSGGGMKSPDAVAARLFEDVNKKYFANMTDGEKQSEFQRIRAEMRMRKWAGKDFCRENIETVWDFQEIQDVKRAHQKEVREKGTLRAGFHKKAISGVRTEALFYNMQRHTVRKDLYKSLLKVVEEKKKILDMQRFWLNFLCFYRFMAFVKDFRKNMNSQITDYNYSLVVMAWSTNRYRKLIKKKAPNFPDRLRIDARFSLVLLVDIQKNSAYTKCKNIMCRFLIDAMRVKKLLNCFKAKTRVMNRCIQRVRAWKKNIRLLKLDIQFKIMKRCKQMNGQFPTMYPRRPEEDIKKFADMFLLQRGKTHMELFKVW
jgi:hypothetical protein